MIVLKNKLEKIKLTGLIAGLISLSSLGVSIFLAVQNKKVLNSLNTSNKEEEESKERIFYTQELYGPTLSIHKDADLDPMPEARRRFLTG